MDEIVYAGLAAAVLTLHLLWIVWILVGWLLTRGRPALTAVHVASLVWGIIAELGPWPCPLTLLEQWLETRSGAAAYQGAFLVHYLDKVVYPDLSEAVVSWAGAGACLVVLGVYGWRIASWARHQRDASRIS